jgi:hypothetical protein
MCSFCSRLTSLLVGIILLGIWSSLECGMGITATSIATLRPVLRNMTSWLSSKVSYATKSPHSTMRSTRHTGHSANSANGRSMGLDTNHELEHGYAEEQEFVHEKSAPRVNYLDSTDQNKHTFLLDATINSTTQHRPRVEYRGEPDSQRTDSQRRDSGSFLDTRNDLEDTDTSGQRLGYMGRLSDSRRLASKQSDSRIGLASRQSQMEFLANPPESRSGGNGRSKGWPLPNPGEQPTYQPSQPNMDTRRGFNTDDLDNTIPIRSNAGNRPSTAPLPRGSSPSDINVYWPNMAILYAHEDAETASRTDTMSDYRS